MDNETSQERVSTRLGQRYHMYELHPLGRLCRNDPRFPESSFSMGGCQGLEGSLDLLPCFGERKMDKRKPGGRRIRRIDGCLRVLGSEALGVSKREFWHVWRRTVGRGEVASGS